MKNQKLKSISNPELRHFQNFFQDIVFHLKIFIILFQLLKLCVQLFILIVNIVSQTILIVFEEIVFQYDRNLKQHAGAYLRTFKYFVERTGIDLKPPAKINRADVITGTIVLND
jgi:hypothetical protein